MLKKFPRKYMSGSAKRKKQKPKKSLKLKSTIFEFDFMSKEVVYQYI